MFCPIFSTFAKSLWGLTQVRFVWTEEVKQAFEILSQALCHIQSYAYFDPKKSVVIQSDACNWGLGLVLLQEGWLVIFASHILIPMETKYS